VQLKNVLGLDQRASYSQYGEDAILFAHFWAAEWSADSKRRPQLRRKGFYVDIGAYAPTQNSNTYLFYKSGWRGINVDPTPGVMDTFRKVRPRDTNLQLAVSEERGPLEFFSWGSPSVFNTLSAEVAAARSKELGAPERITVPGVTLADVLEEHLPSGQQIDFLSVDVEGMDLAVLRSNDWSRFRPGLLLAESYAHTLDQLTNDPLHKFMIQQEYQLHAWAPPTLIYRSQDVAVG
jgi:FkbM family methyltransferase